MSIVDARSRALVVHLTPHRIRIKIPGRERQDAYFAALQRMLEQRSDIVSIRVNALVASVVIHWREGFEITSVRNCLAGLELVLPDSLRARRPARQIASDRRGGGSRSPSFNNSASLASLIIKLTIAIATKRLLEAVIRELIVEAVVRALLPRLYRRPMLPRSRAPRVLLAAAAG